MTNTGKHPKLIRDTNLQLIFIITLFGVMGVASLAPAFPEIMKYFHLKEAEVGLLIAAFTLPGVFLTPIMGILADRVGRKNILIPSLMLFGLAGFTCVFIRDFHLLLIARVFQGIGATSLGSLNVTLIGDLYSGQQRIKAMGYNASVLSIGTASYPAIGGALAVAGWYFPFVLPILAVPFGILIALKLKNPEPEKGQDLKSYLRNTWKNINQRTVWALFIVNILVFFLIYGAYLTYLPILMERRLASGSLMIGIMMSLTSGTTALTSAFIGKINRYLKGRNILIAGTLLYFLAMLFFSFADSYLMLVPPAMLFGLGHGMFIPTIQTLLVGFAPLKQRAAFMSINSMVLRIGQTIGPLMIGLAFALGGVSYAFYGAGIIALIMMGIVSAFVRIDKQES
ncbi:MAG: MFS transporter [Bacteroidales bacterium]|nr:MFS transporter [Bacteroidales bacterium]